MILPITAVSGLKKHTGHRFVTKGVFRPTVLVDANTPLDGSANAAIYHELTHAVERHALQGIVLLLVLPGLGLALYPFFRRHCEKRADQRAVTEAGAEAFKAFVYLTKVPHSRWTRFLYTPSRDERIRRATER